MMPRTVQKLKPIIVKDIPESVCSLFFSSCLVLSDPRASKCPTCSADVSELMTQSNQYRILCEEREKLLELVHILQTK